MGIMIKIEDFEAKPKTLGEQIKELNRQLRMENRPLIRDISEDDATPAKAGVAFLMLQGDNYEARVNYNRNKIVYVVRVLQPYKDFDPYDYPF